MPFNTSDLILVTGAGGVMGTALIAELESKGFRNVRGISSKHADLRDKQRANAIIGEIKPVIVYHLAARVSGIMGNMKNRSAAFYDNVMINTNVVEACREHGVRKVVAMGTTAIYSDGIALPMKESDIWMGPPHHSERPYGNAKRTMLAQLEAYQEQGDLDFAYAISTNLYGENDKFDENFGHVIPSLISKFFRAKHSGDSVTVWGDGTPSRDFLYSRDAARALILLASDASGVVNVASGTTVTIREAVEIIKRVSNFDRDVQWDATKPNGQQLRDYDVSKLRALGFSPAIGVEEGLRRTWNWFSENASSARR